MQNLYAVLGLAANADEAEIKAAFRQLAKAFHPDVSGSDRWSEQHFKAIHHAYRILSDPGRRAVYDAEVATALARARRRFRHGIVTTAAAFLVTVATASVLLLLGYIGPRPASYNGADAHESAKVGTSPDPPADSTPVGAKTPTQGGSEPSLNQLGELGAREPQSASSRDGEKQSRAPIASAESHAPSDNQAPAALITEEIVDYVSRIFLRDREKFADRVAFYNQGIVTRDVVLRSKALYARRWPLRTYRLIPGSLAIRASEAERFEVQFAYDYAVANGHSRAVGIARTKVGLLRSGRELVVTAVQETVQRR